MERKVNKKRFAFETNYRERKYAFFAKIGQYNNTISFFKGTGCFRREGNFEKCKDFVREIRSPLTETYAIMI
jgi:hypothetical protein